jgi:hypothetical protein
VRKPPKRLCKPRGTRGGDFWRLGICPAELPVINYQVKPDRFQPIYYQNMTKFNLFTKEAALIHQHQVICSEIALEVLKQIYK